MNASAISEPHGPHPIGANEAAIDVTGLSHSYDDQPSLRDVSLAIRKAEIFGLLGPNGSGKTSLFRILSTLLLPTAGTVSIEGVDVLRSAAAVRKKIGVVFQRSSLDLKLSPAENLWHQGHLYGLRGADLAKRIANMLERVGLAARAQDRVETLSGGMQRRVELAKGMIHSPAVFLLDEPTTGLDPGARRDVWDYLHALRRSENATVLVTTHLMEEAERCDRLAILNEGRLVALGTPAELKATIGGDVVTLETADAPALAEAIEKRFALPTTVIGGSVRMEIASGHKFVTSVVEEFGAKITSVMVSKPTLEDVFVHCTGHRFWADDDGTLE